MKKLYERYFELLDEFDPIITPMVGVTVGAISAAKLVSNKLKRNKCIKLANTIKNPEKKKEALVRCHQGGA